MGTLIMYPMRVILWWLVLRMHGHRLFEGSVKRIGVYYTVEGYVQICKRLSCGQYSLYWPIWWLALRMHGHRLFKGSVKRMGVYYTVEGYVQKAIMWTILALVVSITNAWLNIHSRLFEGSVKRIGVYYTVEGYVQKAIKVSCIQWFSSELATFIPLRAGWKHMGRESGYWPLGVISIISSDINKVVFTCIGDLCG